MKCPECDHNQLRGQHGLTCKNCQYQFIFDPKSHYCGSKRLTDNYFIKCIDKVSRNNTYFYTEEELYLYMAQKTKSNFIGCFLISIFLTVFGSLLINSIFKTSSLVAIPIFLTLLLVNIYLSRKGLSRKRWAKYLARWKKYSVKYKHKTDILAGLLSTPQLNENPAKTTEPDIYDYGASKLIICEHDIQVDWLVMNKFHSQNGTVIIAESGYPHYLTDQVTQLIETNPHLEVFLLHNTGPSGEAMMQRVKSTTSKWNLSQHKCIDLGITHEQLLKTGIKKSTIDQYSGDYPAHGLSYHQFNSLLAHSIVNSVALGIAINVFSANSDSGISCDFG